MEMDEYFFKKITEEPHVRELFKKVKSNGNSLGNKWNNIIMSTRLHECVIKSRYDIVEEATIGPSTRRK